MLRKALALSLFISLPLFVSACNDQKLKGDPQTRTAVPQKKVEIKPTPTPEPPVMTPTETELTPGTIEGKPKTKIESFSEKFTQTGKSGAADILVVVDDSGSMEQEQKNISDKLKDLLTSIGDADWQIGIITTSAHKVNNVETGNCNMKKLIKKGEANFEETFAKVVNDIGIKGDSKEQGILQAVNGLKCKENPWVRPDSTVSVLILTDEDNCSENTKDCKGKAWASEQYLIDYVEKDMKRTVGQSAGFYGIFGSPKFECKDVQHKGVVYQRLFEYKAPDASNYGNICDASYKSTLQSISKNIAKLLDSKFQLKMQPDANSIVVVGKKANGDAITADDYSMMGQSVVFKKGSEPALGSEVEVKYSVTTTVN